MLPFPALFYRNNKKWEDDESKARRYRTIFSIFGVTKVRIVSIFGVAVLFLIFVYLWHRSSASDVCASSRHNINTANLCSFDKETPDYECTPVSPHRPPFMYNSNGPSLNPVVSVIVPFYNDHSFLEDALDSLLHQSLQHIEILVVNDGSTAEATAVMTKVVTGLDDTRVRIVSHNKNRGLSAARNTGIAHAKTDYIFFLDSDDLIEPTTLEKCVWTLISHPQVGFTKGYTVGFGGSSYTWEKGFELAERFLQENMVTATAMIRKSVFDAVGGYDESIKGGMEDWEFWLKCANSDIWGITIPEYLDWYRRRPRGTEPKWDNFKERDRTSFLNVLRERYKSIFKPNGFPKIKKIGQVNYEVQSDIPFANPLTKSKPRLLVIVPWFTMGGADRFNLNLVEQIIARGWEVTLVATHTIASTWTSHFSRLTPDFFILSNNLRYTDYPRFLCYLIASRSVDVVMVTNSEAGYMLLPYIRSLCPGPAIVDYTHMEEADWKNGGYPRYAVAYTDHIEKHAVASLHLKNWMVERGVPDDHISVIYIGVDTNKFKSDPKNRVSVRESYSIPEDQIAILYAARMIPQKQPMVMTNTFKILMDRNIKFTALVAGEGWQRPQIDEYIARYNLGKQVVVLGEVPPSQMPMLMSACDIVFLPSEFEGIASILFEAMAIENVIVGSDVGGQVELVAPDVGFLLNLSAYGGVVGDRKIAALATAYAEQLEQMIAQPIKVREMGQEGRKRIVSGFTLDHMAQSMENMFCEAVKEKEKRIRLPKRTAIEVANQAMQSINSEEQAYDMYKKNEQLWQRVDEARLMAGQCESDRSELLSARSNLARCKSEQTSTHEQYMRCEQDLASMYLEVEEMRSALGKAESEE